MSLKTTQQFLISCNQTNTNIKNNIEWTNQFNPISLSTNDEISIYSCYINNKNGGNNVIEVDNKNNSVSLTFSFYENMTLRNNIPMPYGWWLSSLSKNGILARKSVNTKWYEFQQDKGQMVYSAEDKNTGEDVGRLSPSTFIYCSNNNADTRFGALPRGQTTTLKTYLSDIINEDDYGARYVFHRFNNTTKKYELYTKNLSFDLEIGNYTPSNLSSIITDKLQFVEEVDVLDEDLNKTGKFLQSKTCLNEEALYVGRTSLSEYDKEYGGSPNPSPIVIPYNIGSAGSYKEFRRFRFVARDGNEEGTGYGSQLMEFKPEQDEYFKLNGDDIKSYTWKMNNNNDSKYSLVGYKYPLNIKFGQILASGFSSNENVIDFNHDIKWRGLVGYTTPTITNPCINKGDSGDDYYIILSLEWNKTNLMNLKNWMDSQYIEDNVKNVYVYDLVNYPNPTNRNHTIQGDRKIHRWINIANNNKETFGTNTPLKDKDDNLVYDEADFPLINYGSDFLGNDDRIVDGTASTNNDFTFGKITHYNQLGHDGYIIGNLNNNGVNILDATYGTDNADYDIFCKHLKYCSKPQLINVRETYIDLDGNTQNLTLPIDETKLSSAEYDLFENIGWGYAYKYTSANPTTNSKIFFPEQKDYIMLKVKTNTGGLCIDVEQPILDVPNKIYKETQGLLWLPFFSSVNNTALMKITAQGSGIHKSVSFDTDEENLVIGKYNKSIISSGIGSPNPILSFDDTISRFNFNNLGNPCVIENPYNTTTSSNINSNAGSEIIAINKLYGQTTRINSGFNLIPYSNISNQSDIGSEPYYTRIEGKYNDYTFPFYNAFNRLYNSQYFDGDNEPLIFYQQGGVFIEKWVEFYPLKIDGINKTNADNFKGNYIKYNPYYQNDIVFFNNEYYIANVDMLEWSVFNLYNVKDVVVYNNNYYFNLQPLNQGFNPETTPLYWVLIDINVGAKVLTPLGDTITYWNQVKFSLENKSNFDKSIFFYLGFNYNDTHNNYDAVNKIYRNYNTINQNGAIGGSQYYHSIPITNNSDFFNQNYDNLFMTNKSNIQVYNMSPCNSVNELELSSQSTEYIATDLAIKSSNPFYVVINDIFNGDKFYDENNIYNGFDIVQKSFSNEDFYISQNNLIHYINNPLHLTSITHRIRKPDGSYLNTNIFSSVIYLVKKQITSGYNISQQQEIEFLKSQYLNKIKSNETKIFSSKKQLLKKLVEEKDDKETLEIPEEENDDEDEEEERDEDLGGDDTEPEEEQFTYQDYLDNIDNPVMAMTEEEFTARMKMDEEYRYNPDIDTDEKTFNKENEEL